MGSRTIFYEQLMHDFKPFCAFVTLTYNVEMKSKYIPAVNYTHTVEAL